MAKFHSLLVKDITQETPDCISISFEIPENLKNDYKYIHGQYLTIKHNIQGEEIRRSYSFCSSPSADKEIRVAIKKVNGGRMSTFLNKELKTGDSLEVMTPMGNFYTELKNENTKQYILFAGGSGITPIFSILKSILNEEPNSKICLFYGNKNKESIIFNNQLKKINLEKAVEVVNILEENETDQLNSGLITKEKSLQLINKYVDKKIINEYFICGPEPMMKNVTDALDSFQVDSKQIHIEYFTTVLKDIEKAEEKAQKNETENIESNVSVIIDGEETSFILSTDGDTILDAAIDNDADVPYACKGAVCCTCKAKIMEGKVEMDENYALTDDEVEEGYVLTCQAHPLTNKVVLDYDE